MGGGSQSLGDEEMRLLSAITRLLGITYKAVFESKQDINAIQKILLEKNVITREEWNVARQHVDADFGAALQVGGRL